MEVTDSVLQLLVHISDDVGADAVEELRFVGNHLIMGCGEELVRLVSVTPVPQSGHPAQMEDVLQRPDILMFTRIIMLPEIAMLDARRYFLRSGKHAPAWDLQHS